MSETFIAGLRRLWDLYPDLSYVQFIDGDCDLISGWLDLACNFLDDHPDGPLLPDGCGSAIRSNRSTIGFASASGKGLPAKQQVAAASP